MTSNGDIENAADTETETEMTAPKTTEIVTVQIAAHVVPIIREAIRREARRLQESVAINEKFEHLAALADDESRSVDELILFAADLLDASLEDDDLYHLSPAEPGEIAAAEENAGR